MRRSPIDVGSLCALVLISACAGSYELKDAEAMTLEILVDAARSSKLPHFLPANDAEVFASFRGGRAAFASTGEWAASVRSAEAFGGLASWVRFKKGRRI